MDGAQIGLFKKEGDSFVRVSVANTAGGKAVFDHIGAGSYQAREIKAPLGYGKSLEVYNFIVSKYYPQDFEWNLTNYLTKIKILKYEPMYKGVTESSAKQLLKDNPDYKMWQNSAGSFNVGVPLGNAKFEVVDASGTKQLDLDTDANGDAKITKRLDPEENYFLKETKPPMGYIRKQALVPFKINDYAALDNFDGKIDFSISNTKDGGVLTVSKMSKDNGMPLAGARFRLTGPRGSNPNGYVKEMETNSSGILSFDGVEYGKEYILKEVQAPKGYKVDPVERKVFFKDDSVQIMNVRFYDELSKANVKLVKVDDKNVPLQGVKFELHSPDGQKIVLPDSNVDGIINFVIDRGKQYSLRELSTVSGYALLPEPINFSVDSDGNMHVVDGGVNTVYTEKENKYSVMRVVNYTEGRVPLAGSSGLYNYLLAGGIVLFVLTLVALKRKREK